jgi:hypothetical protein
LKPGEKLDFYQTKHDLKEPSVSLSFEPIPAVDKAVHCGL